MYNLYSVPNDFHVGVGTDGWMVVTLRDYYNAHTSPEVGG